AVNAAAHVRKQQWADLKATLQTQVDRDPDLLSVGIRSDLGVLRVDTGHHAQIWAKRNEPDRSVDTVQVPITLNRRPWGEVEVCFHHPHQTRFDQAMHHPLVRLLSFFCIAGLIAYTFFVVRVLKLFNNTQVVPDRVRQALDTLAEGLLVLDEKCRIVLANSAFANTVGISADDLADQAASDLAWVREADDVRRLPWIKAVKNSEVQSEYMLRYRLEDGRQRIFSVNAAPLGKAGTKRGALATFRDVTHVEEHRAELEKMLSLLRSSRDEIKRKNAELEILATQDALTGCLNRRAFFERFDRRWDEACAQGSDLSCVMIDIDHFKSVNDTYGHHIGDEVLRQVSRVIRELHQDHGQVCRYGGEEFCLLLPGFDLDRAISEAERTRLAIAEILLDDPAELRLTASLGVSEMQFDPDDPQDLINQADACLYVAKREGRNRV
ncbi:MAG: diguanylate cyclase, partial [Pirellulales bacterium]|nr:diguanylate cyclase [Pirellulales bacterium]